MIRAAMQSPKGKAQYLITQDGLKRPVRTEVRANDSLLLTEI